MRNEFLWRQLIIDINANPPVVRPNPKLVNEQDPKDTVIILNDAIKAAAQFGSGSGVGVKLEIKGKTLDVIRFRKGQIIDLSQQLDN